MSDRYITVTMDLIGLGVTPPGGFTNRQIQILEPGRPRQGWKTRACGKQLPYDRALEFLTTARRPKHRPRPGSPEHTEILVILDSIAEPKRQDAAA